MRSLVLEDTRRLAWQEVPEPQRRHEREAIVRPLAVATCDLDQPMIFGETPFHLPIHLGHECVAEVIEGPERFAPGEQVIVPFQISCGACEACSAGRTANCSGVPFMSTYGFGPAVEQWGGFLADVVSVPYAEHMLVPLPSGVLPSTLASASDNLSDAWRAVGPALAEQPRADVLVVGGAGPGSIGLYAAGLAVALGAGSTMYVDADERRRETAAKLGADTLAEKPRRLGPYPITVDASADPDGLALALRSTAPDGTCTCTAIYFAEQPQMPLLEMYTKGITFRTGRVHARGAMPHVLELAASGALHPELVTTAVVPWSQGPDALLERGWTKLVITR